MNVKRYSLHYGLSFGEVSAELLPDSDGEWVLRDDVIARLSECEHAIDQAVALAEYIEIAAKGAMVDRIHTALSAPFAQERVAEIQRLRLIEAAARKYCADKGWSSSREELIDALGGINAFLDINA